MSSSTPEARSPAGEPGQDQTAETGLGVYVHFPFCARRCDYCAFATWTDRHALIPAYAAGLRREIARAWSFEGLGPASTVYFGGGTPSLVPAEELAKVLAAVERQPDAEVTVECNPESTTPQLLASLAEAGVTRISLGVQSTVSHVLSGLGRAEHEGALEAAVAGVAAAGLSGYNVDLIYGGAGERDEDWLESLETVLSLRPRPTHVSAYALTVETGTPLARDRGRHPDDDAQAGRYELADQVLGDAGYSWYEISNWALPGHACRHNLACWRQGDYRGFGCAAHSHRDGRRWWNIVPIERYLAAVEAGTPATAGEERLGPAQRERERLELSLRTRAGVPASAFADADRHELDAAGLVRAEADRLVLTLRGRLLANEVALRLRPPAVAEHAA